VPVAVDALPHDRADDGVQARAVPATGQDAYSHRAPRYGFVIIGAVSTRLPALAALVCALVLSGCVGNDDKEASRRPIRGHVLTVYSSRPTEGPSAATGRAVAAGERQALADAGYRAGRYRIRLIELSASKPGGGNWDPGQVNENAQRAAHDRRAIAYLGELNLGASAVSVPVTNERGLLQVSPGDGLASLTEQPPRSAAGPERYYPSGHRSFLRLVPDDEVQARLIVDRLSALGVERPGLIVGTGVYARELAAELVADARKHGIEPIATKDLRDDPDTVLDAVNELVNVPPAMLPDAVVLALARDPYTPRMLAELGEQLPQAALITGSGVLVGEPLEVAGGGPSPALEAVAPQAPPGRSRVLARIASTQGPALATPEALWGYEAMIVALDAIDEAQSNGRPADRADVVRAALTPRVRKSPIGTYHVRRNGSVEGIPMALYRLEGDRFAAVRTLF
jgi:branched-chain amino acid transport system substrate-binding protein